MTAWGLCVYICVYISVSVCTRVCTPIRKEGRQQCVAPECETPLGLEEPQGPFSSQHLFFFFVFFFPKSCPDFLIAGKLPEETHGLFKHSQTLSWTPLPPGEHFLYPHVTCHKICPTHAAIDSRSQAGSAIKGDSINSPAATDCLLLKRCRLPSNLIQTSHLLAAALRTGPFVFLKCQFLSALLIFFAHTKTDFLNFTFITELGLKSTARQAAVHSKTNTSQACAYLPCVALTTHHFLQAINEVTDDHAQAFELLEHGAELLAGALAHIYARLVRFLPDDVGSDGGTHVHDLGALADDVCIIWIGTEQTPG